MAKQKIKMGINPVEEKRKNKQLKQMQSTDKKKNESMQTKESAAVSHQWFSLLYPHGKAREIEASLRCSSQMFLIMQAGNLFHC